MVLKEMEDIKKKIPVIVKAISIYYLVSVVFVIISIILSFGGSTFLGFNLADTKSSGKGAGFYIWLVLASQLTPGSMFLFFFYSGGYVRIVASILLAIFSIIVARSLWKGQKWARIVVIIFGLSDIFGLNVLSLLSAIYMLSRKEAKEFFNIKILEYEKQGKKKDNYAKWSLIFGVVSLGLSFMYLFLLVLLTAAPTAPLYYILLGYAAMLSPVISLILGIISLFRIKKNKNLVGKSSAVTGIVISSLILLFYLPGFIINQTMKSDKIIMNSCPKIKGFFSWESGYFERRIGFNNTFKEYHGPNCVYSNNKTMLFYSYIVFDNEIEAESFIKETTQSNIIKISETDIYIFIDVDNKYSAKWKKGTSGFYFSSTNSEEELKRYTRELIDQDFDYKIPID